MENTINKNFQHYQAAHCENGVTTSLLKNIGVDFITEPLAFGIGAGLFYIHIPFVKFSGGPAVSYRSMPGTVFNRTCKALKIPLVRKKFNKEQKAQEFLDAALKQNINVGCQVGVFHLNYFPKEYRFHFNGHNLIVYGKENGQYLISDPVMETTTSLTPEVLNKVRFAKGMLAPKGQIYYPTKAVDISKDTIEKAIVKGIKINTNFMLNIPTAYIIGAKGIKYTANSVRKLRDKVGIKQAGLYLSQIIRMQEEIGTGGGGFIYIYAAFLEQAYNYIPKDEFISISEEITKSGDLWRACAMQMAGIFKGRITEQKHFDEIADKMFEISDIEEQSFRRLSKIKLK
ncbi:MAG: BtrH N-terminal domain-containing protein [Chitinophagales bacterium]